MSGYVLAHGYCFGCGQRFSFNPMRVPSIRATPDLPREPVCQACVDLANVRRRASGLEPIVPLPGSYEACAEVDLHD